MQMPTPRLFLLFSAIVTLLFAGPVAAQWAWRDASGSLVFSDRAPPKSILEKDIVRRPEVASTPRYDPAPAPPLEPTKEAKAPAEATKAAAPAPKPKTWVDREIESRKRQQELAEAQKKAAEEERRKAQVAENCERLRRAQTALEENGLRLARVNSAGEPIVLDDAARAAELERVRGQIQQYCR